MMSVTMVEIVLAIGEFVRVLTRLSTLLIAPSIPFAIHPANVVMAPCTAGESRKLSSPSRPPRSFSNIGCPTSRRVFPTQSRMLDNMPVKVWLCFAIMPSYFCDMTFSRVFIALSTGDVSAPALSNCTPMSASCLRVTMPSSWKRMIASPVAPALNLPR